MQDTVNVTVAQVNAVVNWTSVEKLLELDGIMKLGNNLGNRIVRQMEVDGFALANSVGQSTGTPGQKPGAFRSFADGYAKLDDMLAPSENRYCAVTPSAFSALSDNLKGMVNPSSEISDMFLKTRIKEMAGMNFYKSNSINRLTAGTATNTTPLADSVTAQVGSSIVIDAGTTSGTYVIGQKVTFGVAGTSTAVYAVDPETKTALPTLMEFAIAANVTLSSGAGTLTVFPAVVASGGFQNVSQAIPNEAEVIVTPINSKAGYQNLIYQGDAITLVSLAPPMPENGKCSIRNFQGIDIRVGFGAWNTTDDTECLRVDAIYGWGILRPQHCNVVWGE